MNFMVFLIKVFKNVEHITASTIFEIADSALKSQNVMLLKCRRMGAQWSSR